MLPERIAFIDLETTGANPKHDRITEIGIVEKNNFLDREDVHLIDAWRYLGTARSEAELHELLHEPARVQFDLDTYKLLKSQLAKRGRIVRSLKRHRT